MAVGLLVGLVGLPGCRPVTSVVVDVRVPVGPAVPGLAGVTWNGGDLGLLAPFVPPSVRFGARLDEVSLAEGVLDLDRLEGRVRQVVSAGGRPVVTLSQMPAWLARTPPPGCYEDRRDVPCSSSAMGPTDLGKWEVLVHDVVVRLAAAGAREFEVWNEPNNTRSWADTQDMFVATALASHRAVARASGDVGVPLVLGGPATGEVGGLIGAYATAAEGQGTPAGFVSWHHYTRVPEDYTVDAGRVRGMLPGPEPDLVVSEWNHYGRKDDTRVSGRGAAFALASLIEMEAAGVDRANLYRGIAVGDRSESTGLVDGTGARRPAWWVLYEWSLLRGTRVRASGAGDGVWVRAVRSTGRVDVLVAAYEDGGGVDRDVDVRLDGCAVVGESVVRRIDSGSQDWGHAHVVPAGPVVRVSVSSPAAVWVSAACA